MVCSMPKVSKSSKLSFHGHQKLDRLAAQNHVFAVCYKNMPRIYKKKSILYILSVFYNKIGLFDKICVKMLNQGRDILPFTIFLRFHSIQEIFKNLELQGARNEWFRRKI